MIRIYIVLFTLLIASKFGFSQTQIKLGDICSYYGEKTPGIVYVFNSDDDASAALRLITDVSGISPNFKMLAANIPNAAATIMYNPETKELDRYILYNQTFMYRITQNLNYWASLSILAHEVGHHLNGHSLKSGGSRPTLELEADKYAGSTLARLGASLVEAQSAINSLVSEEGSFTHPGKSARLAAIASGWYGAGGKNNSMPRNSPKVQPAGTVGMQTGPEKKTATPPAPGRFNVELGATLPNFTQSDPNGNNISLADFRGSYVLVHFWASWSGPDRAENKNLVKAHTQFKHKGLALLGVSLDNNRGKWIDAIVNDNLDWAHVSDLQSWNNSVAVSFGIQSIPNSILLDPAGKIIAIGLRGEDLLTRLQSLLGR